MKVRMMACNRPGFAQGKIYKVEGKTRNTYLLRNNNGYLHSVKASDCKVVGFLEGMFG